MKPAMMRVVTRNGSEGTPMTSRASISSLIRIAPICAVKPQPTVADSARPATSGRDLAGVEVRREEAGERRGAELVQRRVALQADLGAGEEGQEGDDADGAADDRQRAGAEGDLGQQPEHLLLVAPQRARGPGQRPAVEAELVAEVVEGAQRLPVHLLERPQADPDPVAGREQRHHCPFGGTSWK